MDEQGWKAGYRFSIALDDRFDLYSRAVFRPGAEVVAIVSDKGWDRDDPPPGTKLWGRVYVDPQDAVTKWGQPAAVLVKYERAKLPGKEEFPVCIIARSARGYSLDKDGAATASNSGEARVTWFYPYD